MRETVGPEMGVKASGGIHNEEEAMAMIEAGATRIGIKTTKCLNCNAGNTANVKETRTICHGYDN